MFDRAREQENIDLKTPFIPEEFVAGEDGKLEKVRLRHAETGAEEEIEASGAFVAIGHIPKSEIVVGQVDTDEDGYIVTEPGSTRTNLAGVLAVGDVVDHTYRQAVTAAGTGCMGALDAERYLRDSPPPVEAHWMPGGEPAEIAALDGRACIELLFPFGIAVVLPPAGLLLGMLNLLQDNRELGIRLIARLAACRRRSGYYSSLADARVRPSRFG